MSYPIKAGIQLSLNNSDWYQITDHNREPIQIELELIENQSRMANGTLRKYVVAKKHRISTSWNFLPTRTEETADGNYGAAWLESFYSANAGVPIYLKIIQSKLSADPAVGAIPDDKNFQSSFFGSKVYSVFITSFSKSISKRSRLSDYVDINIEFTEI